MYNYNPSSFIDPSTQLLNYIDAQREENGRNGIRRAMGNPSPVGNAMGIAAGAFFAKALMDYFDW